MFYITCQYVHLFCLKAKNSKYLCLFLWIFIHHFSTIRQRRYKQFELVKRLPDQKLFKSPKKVISNFRTSHIHKNETKFTKLKQISNLKKIDFAKTRTTFFSTFRKIENIYFYKCQKDRKKKVRIIISNLF